MDTAQVLQPPVGPPPAEHAGPRADDSTARGLAKWGHAQLVLGVVVLGAGLALCIPPAMWPATGADIERAARERSGIGDTDLRALDLEQRERLQFALRDEQFVVLRREQTQIRTGSSLVVAAAVPALSGLVLLAGRALVVPFLCSLVMAVLGPFAAYDLIARSIPNEAAAALSRFIGEPPPPLPFIVTDSLLIAGGLTGALALRALVAHWTRPADRTPVPKGMS